MFSIIRRVSIISAAFFPIHERQSIYHASVHQ